MKGLYIQFFARIAMATAFLSAVADRFGYWGPPGSRLASWGNWENFLLYSNKINFYVSESVGEMLAIVATALEVVLGILLIIGYKTKYSAIASGILLLIFGFSMTIAFGLKSTFTYSVWVGSSACFLLAQFNSYEFSLDYYLKANSKVDCKD